MPTLLKYQPEAFAVFNMIGMLLQIPLVFIYTRGRMPNIPIIMMAFWFFMVDLSNFVTAINWTSSNVDEWWNGEVFCDIMVRVRIAASTGVHLAQLVTNIRILKAMQLNTKKESERARKWWLVSDLVVCLLIPVLIIIIVTFITPNRYIIYQYLGCAANRTLSAPDLILVVLPLIILSALNVLLTLFITATFLRRGKQVTYETISYKPHMPRNYFMRMIIYATIITIVMGPLGIFVGVDNLILYARESVGPIPWANGEPEYYDSMTGINYEMLNEVSDVSITRPVATAIVTQILIMVLSYLLFFFYGTGHQANTFYRSVYNKLPFVKKSDPSAAGSVTDEARQFKEDFSSDYGSEFGSELCTVSSPKSKELPGTKYHSKFLEPESPLACASKTPERKHRFHF